MAWIARDIIKTLRSRTALPQRYVLPILVMVAVSGLTWAGTSSPIDDALMDWRFTLLEHSPSGTVAVVEIDPKSIAAKPTWPWSRSVYATVIRNLQDAGANTIGIDIDFSSLSDAQGDGELVEALSGRPGNVVLPIFLQQDSLISSPNELIDTYPNPIFLEHAVVASANMPLEPNGIARRGWYGTQTEDGYRSSLSAALAGTPSTRTGSFHIDFSINPSQITKLSISEVEAATFDPGLVAGRNILIGASAFELGDVNPAPIYGQIPGVMLHALSYESLVQGRALSRISPLFVLPFVALFLALWFFPPGDWTFMRLGPVHAAVSFGALTVPTAVQAWVPVSLDVSPIFSAQVFSIIGIAAIELNRKTRELIWFKFELARQNELIALVVQDSSDGIIITDESGKIEVLSDQAAMLLDCKNTGHAGKYLLALVPDFPVYPATSTEERDEKTGLEDPGLVSSEYVMRSGDDGRVLEIVGNRTSYSTHRMGGSRTLHGQRVYAYSLRNITMRKNIERAEKEAKELAIAASRAKSHLIAAMSHELLTPLNAIIGFSQILRDESCGNLCEENVRTYSSHINDSGQRLHSMVKDVLQVAKLESGEIGVRADEFRLEVLLEDCVNRVAPTITASGKSIGITAHEQLILRADEQLLRLALSHLLSNAVKFTEEGDRIEARASTSGAEGIRIEIYDTGVGVAAEHLPRLGNAFYQADGSLSRSHEGAGLGLYLAKKYVELHSGTLAFESVKDTYFKAHIQLPPTCMSRKGNMAA